MALSAATTEFRAALDALNITQRRAAKLFNVTSRHIRRWRSGDRRLPHAVAIVCNLLTMGVVTIEQVEAATPRTNGGAEPKPPAPLLVEPARAEAATVAQKVYALEPGTCRWPLGDPQHPDFRFCGSPTVAPPYCNEHRIAAHMTPRPQQAPIGGQKPSSLAAWPPRTGSRDGTGRPSHDVGGPRAAPVALSV